MALNKVQPGQKLQIAAETWNAMVEAARDYQARVSSRGGVMRPDHRDCGIVLVKNTSGQDGFRFDVLGIDAETVPVDPEANEQEFCQRVVLAAVMPAEEHKDSFCILAEPIKDGKFGLALLVGVTQCWVDVKSESDTHAEPAADVVAHLVSGTGGMARILWKQAGTGVKLAIVRLGGGGGPTGWVGKVLSHNVAGCIAQVQRQQISLAEAQLPLDGTRQLCDKLLDAPGEPAWIYLPWVIDWTGQFVTVSPLDGNVGWIGQPILDYCRYEGTAPACAG